MFGVGEELQEQYLLQYISMEAYDILYDDIEPGTPADKRCYDLISIIRE